MSKENLLDMTEEIQAFIKKFEEKYSQSIQVVVGVDESGIISSKNTLQSIERFTIIQMHQRHPELSHIKSFTYRTRKLDFMRFTQSFQYIAFKLGYKKLRIGNLIGRNHASVINSIKQAENYLFWKCPEFTEVYYPLHQKIESYVGIISKDLKGETDSKPMFINVRNTEEDINTTDQSASGAKGVDS